MNESSGVLTDAVERAYLARRENRISVPLRWPRRPGRRSGRRRAGRRALRRAGSAGQAPGAGSARLLAGLALYGVSEALMLAPAVGVSPWDVFHTGLARMSGIPVGTVLIIVGAGVLLLWIPLRQRPGVGTLANIVAIGLVVDLMLGDLPALRALWLRWAVFAAGVLLNAVATGLYIGAGLGAGPRDGLTTGLAARGRSIRAMRTAVEVSVLALGWLLGGNVGLGTLVYAVAIGPLVHVTIPRLDFAGRAPALMRPARFPASP